MLSIGAATKLFVEGRAGGVLTKFTVALWLLIQPPERCPVTVIVVKSSGTGATVIKEEFGACPDPPLLYSPGPEKLVSTFCGHSKLAMLDDESNTQDFPPQFSAASRKPIPWWKVRPSVPATSGSEKAGPSNAS